MSGDCISYWYCPNCKIELDGSHVTYEELCAYCGMEVLSMKASKERVEELLKAEADGRLVVLPCKVGDSYTGICREIVPGKKGWKTKEWLDSGVVVGFEVIAELTAEKAGYNHSRNIDESGEAWFVGEGHCEAAEKALGGGEG